LIKVALYDKAKNFYISKTLQVMYRLNIGRPFSKPKTFDD